MPPYFTPLANIQSVLIVPMYNPSEGWEHIFMKHYREFCDLLEFDIQVVLSDDGSTNDIQEAIQFLRSSLGEKLTYISAERNKGKGAALKAGVKLIRADNYIFTDIDFPYTAESMVSVYQSCLDNRGVVMGIRDKNYYNDITRFRTWLSKILRWFNKLLLQLPSNDTQCGLKAFDAIGGEILVDCKTDRFLIDLEFLLSANQKKVKITPVQVSLRNNVEFTKFNTLVLFKELANFAGLIWRYRIKG
ncbi:MAG: glycosyltransferase family 2 protein [Saprospiraceae bacterium]|nr:glycosyltransferase family 2 protein [Saprospiraceae bacterium]